jgi:hypothetical protein
MPTLEMTAEEAEELRFVLENYFAELRMEIERTESGAFRSKLKTRENLIKRLLDDLSR